MKNKIVVVLIFGMFILSCEQPNGSNGNDTSGTPHFVPIDSSYTGFFEYISNLVSKAPENANGSTVDRPLSIKISGLLPGNDIEKIQNLSNAIKNVGFFAIIDLSDAIGVINIESSDFLNYLVGIILPDSVNNIGNNAFRNCTNLKNITIPNSVTTIGNYAFSGCTGLVNITIPNSINTFGQYVFNNCTNLKNVILPDSVASDSFSLYYAFYNCRSLESIIIPQGQQNISTSTFENCISLTSVLLPEGLSIIWSSAFKNCTNLTSIVFPESIITIHIAAFEGCSNLSTVVFKGNLATFPNNLDITFPGDLESKYLLGGAGTYIRTGNPLGDTWTKIE